MKRTWKRARQQARDVKVQSRDAGEIIEISSSDEDAERSRAERSRKAAIFRALNAFQHSPGFGMYVCERFRDPRFHSLDEYFPEVRQEAFGIEELKQRLAFAPDLALRRELHGFSDALERIAASIRANL